MNIIRLNINKPHDSFWRLILSHQELFASLIILILPQRLTSQIVPGSFELMESSSVDERLKVSHGDIVYRATLKNKKFIYFVLEQQTNANVNVFIRLIAHEVAICSRHLKEGNKKYPLVAKIYLYTGHKSYVGPRNFVQASDNPSLAKEYIGRQAFFFEAIRERKDEDLAKCGPISLALIVSKNGSKRDFCSWFEGDRSLFWELYEQCSYKDIIMSYIFACDKNDPKTLCEKIIKSNPTKQIEIMSAAHQLINQGRVEGITEGIAKGRVEGITEGIAKGKVEGITEGIAKGRVEAIQQLTNSLLTKNVISKEELSKIINEIL